jgi:preprotein translocase subunit Sss1
MTFFSVLLVIAFPICGLIGYYIKTKNQERIKLIEKGINPDEGLSISDYRKQTNLKNGILFISLGLGLFVGHLLVLNFSQLDILITYAAMLLLFGGIGFLINFMIIRNWNPK